MQKIKNWDKIQIPREMRLKHYYVYYEGHGVGCYAENYQKTYLGDICDEGLVEFEYKAYEIK